MNKMLPRNETPLTDEELKEFEKQQLANYAFNEMSKILNEVQQLAATAQREYAVRNVMAK